jgi:hypothetical protein
MLKIKGFHPLNIDTSGVKTELHCKPTQAGDSMPDFGSACTVR